MDKLTADIMDYAEMEAREIELEELEDFERDPREMDVAMFCYFAKGVDPYRQY